MFDYIELKLNGRSLIKLILLCLSSILLLLFVSVNAQAELFSQPPSDGTFEGYSSNANSTFGTTRVADDFTLGSAATINGITWWGLYKPDTNGKPPTDFPTPVFTFTFYDDKIGSPGSPLATPSGSLTYSYSLDHGVYVYTYVLDTPFDAEARTKYWLSIFDNTNSTWSWMRSEAVWYEGDVSKQEFDNEGYWNDMDTNVAFRLTGSPVPIPSAAWLLGSGLIGLVLIRRRIRIR